MSDRPLTFQDAVSRLQSYWADRGCVVWLPHNVEVGAGTMNPGTFLHVLGPEPWNVVYLEPSIRPDDARYGENPNRMGRHHQIQVILKPDPGDPQGLYLQSLSALGIDLRRHDIRFVEDNWESPVLGAWGLGWEVWLDGLEITQFTYFQQAGSLDCDPVSVEITYGLDRILMALQDVAHFRDLAWNEHLRFGDVLLGYEQQTSRYYFEIADVARLQRLYDDTEAEAEMALDNGLVRPAHDYVLRCSHLFNVLDARGAVGVTERARFFARMRRLARRVAEGFLAERSELGFPLLERDGAAQWIVRDTRAEGAPPEPPPTHLGADRADFVLEVGTEELPAGEVDAAVAALRASVPAWLAEARLGHGGVTVAGTPRRLTVTIRALAALQEDRASQVVGPPERAAFDAEGRPTKAAEGFARSVGVGLDDLERVERGGEVRVAAVRREEGRPAGEVIAEGVPALLAALPFSRGMRWNESGQTFSRPVRWIVALHGAMVVPVRFAGVEAGRTTRGLRALGSPPLHIASAEDHSKLLRSHGVVLDPEARREEVRRQVTRAAEGAGGQVDADPALVDEVANLVEQPHAIVGAFDEAYLRLPAAVLVTVLHKHQRCFPVTDVEGGLLARFVTVANGASVDEATVRHGNEAVVRARFADATYFWDQDTARPLGDFTPELAGLTFQTDLGSMLDKVERLEELVPRIAVLLELPPEERAAAARAAALSKSDLATAMVVDFTSLQGAMGREYALRSNEAPAVAQAIYEQYLPRGAEDAVPATGPGTALAVADRLDSLVGLFAAGLRPTGAQDPYALRRAALGIAAILIARGRPFDLRAAVDAAIAPLPIPVDEECRHDVLAFLARRLEGLLRDAGYAADVVAAALAVHAHDPWAAQQAVQRVAEAAARPDWPETLTAYARCARIVRGEEIAAEVDPALFSSDAERHLLDAVTAWQPRVAGEDPGVALDGLRALAPAINRFFDEVLVMADDPAVRTNRLALVRLVDRLPAHVADLRLMEGS